MELVKVESKRTRPNGQVYTDYFLVWEYNGRIYKVRVVPSFAKDFRFFAKVAKMEESQETANKSE